jgi:predicted ATP-grasp superfamily ATP-dependent carboligase
MRVFVYEHLCAMPGAAPSSLRTEGRAMLSAVVADFAALHYIEVVTLLAADLTPPLALPKSVRVHVADNARRQPRLFRSIAADCQFGLIIAPETDHVLWRYCCRAADAGLALLGPSPEAVRLAGNKVDFADRFRLAFASGLPQTVLCQPCEDWEDVTSALVPRGPWDRLLVFKPRCGAGSQATFLVRCHEEAGECLKAARAEGYHGEMVQTPYVAGTPASVAVLLGPGVRVPLPAARQRLSGDGRFRYQGGSMPLPPPLNRRAQTTARLATQTVPGLFGYVGVDLVLGAAPDGSQDYVIEINPRLTTSYLGYRRLSGTNLAQAMLTASQGGTIEFDWRPGPIHFSPNDVPV